jgi:hypothetical protein
MSAPFNKVRFSASFVVPIGPCTKKTRRFVGTMKVAEGTTDLAAVVIGMLAGIAREENLDDARSIRVTASAVQPRTKKRPAP